MGLIYAVILLLRDATLTGDLDDWSLKMILESGV